MSFAPKFDPIYKVICEALKNNNGKQCKWSRIDQKQKPGIIIENIKREIIGADLIIADVTDLNPNVLYELGMAHFEKGCSNCILLTQSSIEDLPFDLKHLHVFKYTDSIEGADKLKTFIRRTIRTFNNRNDG